jgi:O-antigen/teichoic acid export membrane protein
MIPGVSLRDRLFRAGGWTLAGRVLLALAAFAVNALLARLLQPQEVAGYFLLASLATVVALVAQLGLPTSVVRFAAESLGQSRGGRAAGAIHRAVLCGLASGVLAGGALAVAGGLAAPAWHALDFDGYTYGLAGLWVVVMVLGTIIAESFRGLHDSRLAGFFGGALANCLTVAFLVVAWALSPVIGLHRVVAVAAAAAAFNAGLGWYLLRGQLQRLGPAEAFPVRELLATALPLMVAAVAIFVVTQADLWIAAGHFRKEEVALYGAAARLVQLVMMPMLILNMVLLPLVAELHGRGDWAAIERVVRGAAALAGVIAVAVLAALAGLAPELLRLVYGPFYAAGAVALLPLCAGQAINALCGGAATVLMMSGAGRSVMVISLACSAWLLAGGPLAAQAWGLGGLAVVAGSTTALHGLVCMLWLRRSRGIWTFPSLASLAQALRLARDAALGPRPA